jgi:hypothetical protein
VCERLCDRSLSASPPIDIWYGSGVMVIPVNIFLYSSILHRGQPREMPDYDCFPPLR